MAAGIIQGTVTTTSGETIEMSWLVDDTVTPTKWYNASHPVNSAGASAAFGSGANGATVPRVALATDSPGVTAVGQTTKAASLPVAIASDQEIAHDGVDSGSPTKIGMRALAHGTNPTAVAAADRTDWLANRAGVPWVIGGHPNIITRSHLIADSDGAQTDAALLTVSAGSKIVVTQLSVKADASNTTNVAVKVGFGAATIPAASLAGTAAILLEGQFAASGGHQIGNGSGILGVGADGEDLRITCGDPVSGNLRVTYSYYTIES